MLRNLRFMGGALSVLLLLPSVAFGYGADGHEVVAMVAERLLTPATRTRVDAILALEPGATLASISSWADQTRDRSTASWHYVNMPRGGDCVYVAARDCPGGNCVVAAVNAQVQRLAQTSGAEQLEALKYVVHFVGDVHQPLHAGFADDKGGNTYQLQAFGKGTNLHAVWDTALVRDIDPSSSSIAGALLSSASPPATSSLEPATWATESCRVASRPDFYPATHKLEDDYAQTFRPVVLSRLKLAGQRLAAVLNSVFDAAQKIP